jgi:hypothetical protein
MSWFPSSSRPGSGELREGGTCWENDFPDEKRQRGDQRERAGRRRGPMSALQRVLHQIVVEAQTGTDRGDGETGRRTGDGDENKRGRQSRLRNLKYNQQGSD